MWHFFVFLPLKMTFKSQELSEGQLIPTWCSRNCADVGARHPTPNTVDNFPHTPLPSLAVTRRRLTVSLLTQQWLVVQQGAPVVTEAVLKEVQILLQALSSNLHTADVLSVSRRKLTQSVPRGRCCTGTHLLKRERAVARKVIPHAPKLKITFNEALLSPRAALAFVPQPSAHPTLLSNVNSLNWGIRAGQQAMPIMRSILRNMLRCREHAAQVGHYRQFFICT